MVIVHPSVSTEFVGDEAVVFFAEQANVLRLNAEHTRLLRAIQEGHRVDPARPPVRQLEDWGVVEVVDAGVSRRSVVTGGGALLGALAGALALPDAAAASSSVAPSAEGVPGETYLSTYTDNATAFFLPANESDQALFKTFTTVAGPNQAGALELVGYQVPAMPLVRVDDTTGLLVWNLSSVAFGTVFGAIEVGEPFISVQGEFLLPDGSTYTATFETVNYENQRL